MHSAAISHNAKSASLLVQYGASVDKLNRDGLTPLEAALQSCSNMGIEPTAAISELLLGAGAKRTPQMKKFVARIGTDFEFHRSNYNPDSAEETSKALTKLYELFDVTPAPPRQMHDGKSPIHPKAKTWQQQHQELWQLLVPSSGNAETIQGEVIRISGKISHEIEGNGGCNWDKDFARMADAFLTLVGTGKALAPAELKELQSIVRDLEEQNAETRRIAELAVKWVIQNPDPVKLTGAQTYKR